MATAHEPFVEIPNVLPLRRFSTAEVLLVIEAAESSLPRNQKIKLPVYAAAGIPEYWIADLEREMLIVHRKPKGNAYQSFETQQGEDIISPACAPELSFAVRRAFE